MRLVIDMQGAQAGSRFRGIGRYTLAISRALARTKENHEVVLAFNNTFVETIQPIASQFQGHLFPENFVSWNSFGSVGFSSNRNDGRRLICQGIRESFLLSLSPDAVFVPSLFEAGETITSVNTIQTSIPTAVVLYDLIPLIYAERYLKDPTEKRWYLDKLDQLRRADFVFSISESSRLEAVRYLGIGEDKVINISSACDDLFRPMNLEGDSIDFIKRKFGITLPFIMYTGGNDHRKNIEGLVAAYANLSLKLRMQYQLVIVCDLSPLMQAKLMKLGSEFGLAKTDLVLTGFVSDQELVVLYNMCALFVFPSEHEGFGLPVLEAMACGKPVVASNNSSIPEVLGRHDCLFDCSDWRHISMKIAEVLGDRHLMAELGAYNLERAKQFSWDSSARRVWTGLSSILGSRSIVKSTKSSCWPPPLRPRLALVGPACSVDVENSAEIALLLSELSLEYDVTLIVENVDTQSESLWVEVRSARWFNRNFLRFDRVVYYIRNHKDYGYQLKLCSRIPGVVLLGDFNLSELFWLRGTSAYRNKMLLQSIFEELSWKGLASTFNGETTGHVGFNDNANNIFVLKNAIGIVALSGDIAKSACQYYSEEAVSSWFVCAESLDGVAVLHSGSLSSGAGHKLGQQIFVRSLGLSDGLIKLGEAIECLYFEQGPSNGSFVSIELLSRYSSLIQRKELAYLAQIACTNFPSKYGRKKILIDITEPLRDSKPSGQPVFGYWKDVLAVLVDPPRGYGIELVSRRKDRKFYYERRIACSLLGIPADCISDEEIQDWRGAVLLAHNLLPHKMEDIGCVPNGIIDPDVFLRGDEILGGWINTVGCIRP